MNALIVTDAKFSSAGERDRERGLLGFVQVVLNDVLTLDGITLRMSAEGHRYLSYPSKSARGGSRFPYVKPRGEAERKDVERQVFAALGLKTGD